MSYRFLKIFTARGDEGGIGDGEERVRDKYLYGVSISYSTYDLGGYLANPINSLGLINI